MSVQEPLLDTPSPSSSTAAATAAVDAAISAAAMEVEQAQVVVDPQLLRSTSTHAYRVIRTKLWNFRYYQGTRSGEDDMEEEGAGDIGRSTKRRKAAPFKVFPAPELIRKFEEQRGNMVQVVVKVQADGGEASMGGGEEVGHAGVEISKPIASSAAETLTKLLDSLNSPLHASSSSRPANSNLNSDRDNMGRSTPRSIPSPKSPTPARAPSVTTNDGDSEHEPVISVSFQSPPATITSIMPTQQSISKEIRTREATVQVVEIEGDDNEGEEVEEEEEVGVEDERADNKEILHNRRRQASQASLTSMVSMASGSTSVILIGSVSGPAQKWEQKKSAADELVDDAVIDRRASVITVDWEGKDSRVAGSASGVQESEQSTTYDCEPTQAIEQVDPMMHPAKQDFSTPHEVLTPVHGTSPDVEVFSTPPNGMICMDEQALGGLSGVSPINTYSQGVKLEAISDTSINQETSELERQAKQAMPILPKLSTDFSSSHQHELSEEPLSLETDSPTEIRQDRTLEAVQEEEEEGDQGEDVSSDESRVIFKHSLPPQVDFVLPPDICTLDIDLNDLDFDFPMTPITPITPITPTRQTFPLTTTTNTSANISPPSSRPQSRQSRPSSRHRHPAPPIPPRSPNRKSIPNMGIYIHGSSSQSRLSQMLDFGESFLSRAVEGDSENEAIWERRREEVMEPLVGSPVPLPGCLRGASLCGEGVVGSGGFIIGSPPKRFSGLGSY